MFTLLKITIFSMLGLFLFPQITHGLTLYEIMPFQGDKYFSEFQKAYDKVPQSEILEIEEDERPDSEALKTVTDMYNSVPDMCKNVTDNKRVRTSTKRFNNELDKFRTLPKVSSSVDALKAEIERHLKNCADSNQYLSSLSSLDSNLSSLNQNTGYQSLTKNTSQCNELTAESISSSITNYERYNDDLRETIGTASSFYNSRLDEYNGLVKDKEILAEQNNVLKNISEDSLSGFNFLDQKIDTNQQEINLINENIIKIFKSISIKDLIDSTKVEKELNDQKVAISLDSGLNWIGFKDNQDLLDYLKLTKQHSEELNQIADLNKEISTKKEELNEASTQKVAKKVALVSTQIISNSITEKIETNNRKIASVTPELIKLNALATERIKKGQEVKLAYNKVFDIYEECSADSIDDYKKLESRIKALNNDFKIEYERLSGEQLHRTLERSLKQAETGNVDDAYQVYRALTNQNNLLDELITCNDSEQLSIRINSEQTGNNRVRGVNHISFYSENPKAIFTEVQTLIEKSKENLPLEYIDIAFYENKLLSEITNSSISEINNFEIRIENWSQEIVTYKNTYANYTCNSGSWKKDGNVVLNEVVRERCKREKQDEVGFEIKKNNTFKESFGETISNNLANKYQVFGECRATE